MNERLELFTSLTPQECIERLSRALEWSGAATVSRPSNAFARELIRGSVETDHFELMHLQRGNYATCLSAMVQSHDSGTAISGHFYVPRETLAFGSIFRLLACLFG